MEALAMELKMIQELRVEAWKTGYQKGYTDAALEQENEVKEEEKLEGEDMDGEEGLDLPPVADEDIPGNERE